MTFLSQQELMGEGENQKELTALADERAWVDRLLGQLAEAQSDPRSSARAQKTADAVRGLGLAA